MVKRKADMHGSIARSVTGPDNVKLFIAKEVKELYWKHDINCARTMMMTLSKCMNFRLEEQLLAAGIGMHGAGGYRAQCGLVEGSLMFIAVYLNAAGKTDSEISDICYDFADKYKAEFSSLSCYDLRPGGFNEDDPPHLCEKLTGDSIMFTYNFINKITTENA